MDQTGFLTLLRQHELVLAYCSTPACSVCKVLRPKVELLIDELGDWRFIYIDITESQEFAGQNLIFTVPTLLLFVQGREVRRFSRHFGLDELRQALEKYQALIR